MPTLFQPNKKYAVNFDIELTSAGREAIFRLIRDKCGHYIHLDHFGGMELVNEDGKIAKRIKNNLYKHVGLKLPDNIVSQIGNLATNYSMNHGEFIIWADTNMDVWDRWGRDDIHIGGGNQGSCFRDEGEYRNCWLAMDDDDRYYALLLAYGDGHGEMEGPAYARCWLQDSGGHLVTFNSYGEDLTRMSIIFAKALGLETQLGYLNYDNGMYVNGDRVNVIHEKISEYKPGVSILCHPDEYEEEAGELCYSCESRIEVGWDSYAVINGFYYCEDCYSYCDECEEATVSNEIDYSDFSHRYLCEYCLENSDYLECTGCGAEIEEDDEGVSIHNRGANYVVRHYCADCAGHCAVCDCVLPRGETRCDEHFDVQPELIAVAVGD